MDALPPIPTRSRHQDTSKRHTLALDSARPQTARPHTSKSYRSSNRITLQPASTEVISSLISSLSAISTPAEDLFDNLLPPSSAPAPSQGTPPKTQHGETPSASGMAADNSDNAFLHPNDAALPPVIRTAKPPSGFSPLTAPKRASTGSVPKPSKSSPNLKEQAMLRSIGNLSIEPGPPASSDRLSDVSDSSWSRNVKDLRIKSSKEKMKEMDRERKRSQKGGGAKSPIKSYTDGVERPTPSPFKRSFSEDPAAKASAPSSPTFPIAPPFLNEPLHGGPDSGPGGIGSGRIPTRESSLRHSPVSGRTRNRKSYRASHVPREIHLEHPNEEDTSGPVPRLLRKDETEDQVTRRIKELKTLKAQREKMAQSDDESQVGSRHDREERREANKGRSSLPAPSSPTEQRDKSSGKRRRLSDPSQKRPQRPMTPPADKSEKTDRHRRTPSTPLSPARNSSSMARDERRPSTADSIDDAVAAYLDAPRLSQKIYHPQTGRAISFSDVGDPDGSAVFCCVGMGTTRYLTAFYDELAATLKLRLITLDRPGIGESEPYRNGPESPLAWPGKSN